MTPQESREHRRQWRQALDDLFDAADQALAGYDRHIRHALMHRISKIALECQRTLAESEHTERMRRFASVSGAIALPGRLPQEEEPPQQGPDDETP